jgi:sortase A
MKSRMKWRAFFSARTNLFLRRSQDAFLVIGVLMLSYAGYRLLDARLFQADQNREFDRALKGAKSAQAGTSPKAAGEGSLLGRIEIISIGLTAMIQEGTDDRTLERAVGHIAGTALPGQHGNVALAGHRDTFFRGLRNIRQNDEIRLTTLSGTCRYRVDSTKVVDPDQTEVLDDDENDILTLVTCYPFNFIGAAPRRFIVRAHRISE